MESDIGYNTAQRDEVCETDNFFAFARSQGEPRGVKASEPRFLKGRSPRGAVDRVCPETDMPPVLGKEDELPADVSAGIVDLF